LPTVVNQVPRINNIAGKIFAGLGAFILDLITFPVRLLTCIPRVLANSKGKNHALHKLLVANGVNSKDIDSNSVKVTLMGEEKQGLIEVADSGQSSMPIYHKTESFDVDFVTQPAKKNRKRRASKRIL